MSITSEIERIKTNIANAYTELENKGATITGERNSDNLSAVVVKVPTGGGASINGILEPKVCSGNVSKGDLVVCTEQTKDVLIDSESDIKGTYLNFSNKSSIYDGNLETYCICTMHSGTTGALYFKMPTYDKFGITEDTIITKFGFKYVYSVTKSGITRGFNIVKYKKFNAATPEVIGLGNTSGSVGVSATRINEHGLEYPIMFKASDLQNYGGRMYLLNSGEQYNLYGIKTYIEYIDNGVVKTATSTADIVVGVSNSDGNDGDTIDVYVPNVVEEGVSYMNRMMEMNEQLQEKASAYDILTGEVE